MQALFFEVTPKQGHAEKYFERAAQLKPELDKHTGLLFLDRYRSLTRADTFLSHQFWQDEASIARWRANCPHYHTQVAGRNMHFEDYRLRVGPVIHEINSAGSDRTFAIHGSYRDDDAPERVVVVIASNHPLPGLAHAPDTETFDSVNFEHSFVSITPVADRNAADALVTSVREDDGFTTARICVLSRDYGMFDRAEAPQFMPEPGSRA